MSQPNQTLRFISSEELSKRFNNDSSGYVDCGDFYLSLAKQCSDIWREDRRFAVNSSTSAEAAGFGLSKKISSDQRLKYASEQITESFDAESQRRMDLGIKYEPIVRDKYSQKIGRKVFERGLAVAKWNLFLRASIDGEVEGTSGIIEIKCPEHLYPVLHRYLAMKRSHLPYRVEEFIGIGHYCQMQMNMAVWGKKWCDYIVYGIVTKKMVVLRVNFDLEFWSTKFYPRLLIYINNLQSLIPTNFLPRWDITKRKIHCINDDKKEEDMEKLIDQLIL